MSAARRASTQELRQENGTKVKEEGRAKPQRVSSANSSGHHQSEGTTKRASAPKNQLKSSASKNHQVKKGETLSEIAKMHQVSVQELQQANKIKGKDVKLGQKLVIP
jgi:LysM repeat protein